ncbi:MAG: sugar ABC transporter permease [Armatimonadota bacterium]|nr:sugar ABC transporter permease [Armatimonadota bacterium]MDR7574473.1 sugar ABC transporter permease [Armatimonadota bacterium]
MARVAQEAGAEAVRPAPAAVLAAVERWLERQAGAVFILPAVLLVFFLSLFPLLLSAYLSLTRLQFVPGGFELRWVGLAHYHKLLLGSERSHFLGTFGPLGPFTGFAFAVAASVLLVFLIRAGGSGVRSVAGRALVALVTGAGLWLGVRTLGPGGRPGTLLTTLLYVGVGVTVQYWLGLLLAYLCSQEIAGRRLFRVVFLLPMMITPVGIAYTFRILMDLGKGPFAPVWRALGLAEVSWANSPWGARLVVMIGDIWQWTPFMFVVLLAALESLPSELIEAAMVDGASRWQIFWKVSWPQLLPVSSTVILIRMIEAFKIVDLPNVLTNGGPGTATESLTLHAYMAWRTLDIGGSAAVAYTLLFVVTFAAMSYITLVHRRLAEVG